MRAQFGLSLSLVCACFVSCTNAEHYAHGVCALYDQSGTYADQKEHVIRVIKQGVLPKMSPGDTLIVAKIDSESYSKDNVMGTLILDRRPSLANAQKLQFSKKLDALLAKSSASKFTDISGGLLLCSEYLKETHAGKQSILVFSDMREELPAQTKRSLRSDEFKNIQITVVNVKKLGPDNRNPTHFRKRLALWEDKLKKAGASGWEVIFDSSRNVF